MEANLARGCDIPEEDVLRARFHALLARLLGAPITEEDLQTVRALEGAESAVLYMPVGTIGRVFMAVEAKGFEMTA